MCNCNKTNTHTQARQICKCETELTLIRPDPCGNSCDEYVHATRTYIKPQLICKPKCFRKPIHKCCPPRCGYSNIQVNNFGVSSGSNKKALGTITGTGLVETKNFALTTIAPTSIRTLIIETSFNNQNREIKVSVNLNMLNSFYTTMSNNSYNINISQILSSPTFSIIHNLAIGESANVFLIVD